MAERKEITKLYVVTDSETSYDNIGDIDGGWLDPDWLKDHIKRHGSNGLIDKLAWMNYQIMSMQRKVNSEKNGMANAVKQPPSDSPHNLPPISQPI